MTTDQKKNTISSILSHLSFEFDNRMKNWNANPNKEDVKPPKHFDYGETFIHLAFRSDSDLKHIVKLMGI